MADRLPNHRLIPIPEPFRHPLAPIPPPRQVPALLPLIEVDADLHDGLERLLRPVALRAQTGDWTARDALFQAFEAKLWRICRRIPLPAAAPGAAGVWDRDDLWQEGWLVFAETIERWPSDIPFGRYLLAHFPWRLRDAVRANLRRTAVPPRWGSRDDQFEAGTLAPCPRSAGEEAWTDLTLCLADLDQIDRTMIDLQLGFGLSYAEIAGQLPVSVRTVQRRFARLRQYLGELER